MKVAFCQIDAKNDAFCGYEPVAFTTGDRQASYGPENEKLSILMVREYLVRLGQLQAEIRAKYEPLWTDYPQPSEYEPIDEDDPLTEEENAAAKAVAKELFPGAGLRVNLLYYT